jgi:hypothetical protein
MLKISGHLGAFRWLRRPFALQFQRAADDSLFRTRTGNFLALNRELFAGTGKFLWRSVSWRLVEVHSGKIESPLHRHARACRGHPRLPCGASVGQTWMAGTSPAMTPEKWFNATGTLEQTASSFLPLTTEA